MTPSAGCRPRLLHFALPGLGMARGVQFVADEFGENASGVGKSLHGVAGVRVGMAASGVLHHDSMVL